MPRAILACWGIFLVYWGLSARSVKPVQETVGSHARVWLLLRALLVAALMTAGSPLFPIYPWSLRFLPHARALRVASEVLVVIGLALALWARKELAQNWSGSVPTFRQGHELITTGPYGYARHPIYTGLALMLLGTELIVGTVGAGLAVLVIVLWFAHRMRLEEALLAKHFPEEYPAYARRVKAVVPFLW